MTDSVRPVNTFKEVLPKQGLLHLEDIPSMVLCKPKLLPLKSVTLEKLEKMQKDAQDLVRKQESAEQQLPEDMFAAPSGGPVDRLENFDY